MLAGTCEIDREYVAIIKRRRIVELNRAVLLAVHIYLHTAVYLAFGAIYRQRAAVEIEFYRRVVAVAFKYPAVDAYAARLVLPFALVQHAAAVRRNYRGEFIVYAAIDIFYDAIERLRGRESELHVFNADRLAEILIYVSVNGASSALNVVFPVKAVRKRVLHPAEPRLYQNIIGFYDFFKFENVSMRKRFFRRERGFLVTVGRRRDVRAFFRRRVFRQRRAEIFVMLSVLSAYAEIFGRDRGRVVFSDIFSVERIVNEIRVVDIAYDTLSFLLYAEGRVRVALRSKDIDVVIIRNAFLQLDLIAQKIGIFADRERIFKHCEHILGNAEIHAGHALASHINNVSRGLFHLNHALIDAERVNAVVDLFVLRYLCFKYRSFVRKIGIALFGVFLDSALHIAPGNILVTREYGYRDITGQPASQHHCLSVCFVFEGDILRDNVVGRLISV